MYDILDGFTPEANFYEVNPQLFSFKPLSSKIMWAIALLEHPKSKYADFRPEERKNLIAIDFLKDPDFDWNKYEEDIKRFVQFSFSDKMKLLRTWRYKLHERDDFIANTPYNAATAEFLDKILSNTVKLWVQLRQCEKDVLDEEETQVLGDAQESLSEKGTI